MCQEPGVSEAGSTPLLMGPLPMLLLRLLRRQAASSCKTHAPDADLASQLRYSELMNGFVNASVPPAPDNVAYQMTKFQTYMPFTSSVSLQARTAMLENFAAVCWRIFPRKSMNSS